MKLTKKQQIELKAKELFWKHGFKKVTIDEICKKANVSRKTFYTFYENKTALVIFILQEMTMEIKAVYAEILEDDLPFALKMEKMLALKLKKSENLSMEFMADFYNPDAEELLHCFNKMKEDSLSIMMDFFSKAQQKGEINPHLDLNYVMWMMQRVMEQCSSPELLALFPTAESMTRQISQSLLYGIMPVKSSN